MSGVGRREVLRAAFLGPVIFGIGQVTKVPELIDLEGRPINKIADVNNMTPLEREHFIQIDLPSQVIAGRPFKVTFSMPNHPAETKHHISWLRVYVDNDQVNFVTFAPAWQLPEVTYTFTFTKGMRIDAVAECTRHELWGMSAPLVIVPSGSVLSTDVSVSSVAVPPPSWTRPDGRVG
jgi:desulfoferrodoxin (superoxide reductase-like protein)